jgi:hypothetical protein
MRSGETRVCPVCTKEFFCAAFRIRKSAVVTCSHTCRATRSRASEETACVVCQKTFHLKKSHRLKGKNEHSCSRACRGVFLQTNYAGEANPNSRYTDSNVRFFAYRLNSLKSRSKKIGKPFNLTAEYLSRLYEQQQGLCFYSGIPMKFTSDGFHKNQQADPDTLSVDRLDSNRGYEIGNVALCCNAINKMKGNSTIEEIEYFLSKLVSRFKSRIG